MSTSRGDDPVSADRRTISGGSPAAPPRSASAAASSRSRDHLVKVVVAVQVWLGVGWVLVRR